MQCVAGNAMGSHSLSQSQSLKNLKNRKNLKNLKNSKNTHKKTTTKNNKSLKEIEGDKPKPPQLRYANYVRSVLLRYGTVWPASLRNGSTQNAPYE